MIEDSPPFTKASTESDIWYKCLNINKRIYWSKIGIGFSEELKNLMNSMLAEDPQKRLSMSEILNHPWVNGETPTKEEIF